MRIDEILEVMIKAKLRLEDGQINYALGAIDEAIQELKANGFTVVKKYIRQNEVMK